MLLYYAVRNGRTRGFRLVGNTFEEQSYGIVLSRQAIELVDDIDIGILRIREDYRYTSLAGKWIDAAGDV